MILYDQAMKQQIDFYLLPFENFNACFPFVCRLADKIYHQGHKIKIRLESSVEAEGLDRLLWTFRDTSFLPHKLIEANSIITEETAIPDQRGNSEMIIINCCLTESPITLNNCRSLLIVPNQPHLLDKARIYYRFYQKNEYLIQTHKMGVILSVAR